MQLHYIFCLLFFCSTSLFLKSQPIEWAPLGAHWYFCEGTGIGSPPCGGYFYEEVTGDTVIAGQACRKISGYQKNWQNQVTPLENRYTFSQNDSVYFYQADSNRFLLTYDFTAEVGDTLEFPSPHVPAWEPDDISFQVRVDSIVRRVAGQDSLRFFYVSPVAWDNFGFPQGWYAEKIGGANRITPFPTVTIPEIDGDIRCYGDNSAFSQFSTEACDFTATGWFGENAEWTYGYIDWTFQGYYKMELSGDTMLQGLPCKKVQRRRTGVSFLFPGVKTTIFDDRYVYEAFDKVSVWNGNGFTVLYDFNLQPGDTLTFAAVNCPERQYVIDSVGITEIDGVELRYQKARMFPGWPFTEIEEITIIERLGEVYRKQNGSDNPFGFFFLDEKYACLTDLPFWGLRCYSDTDIDLFKIGTLPCDFIINTIDAEPFALELFPNPVNTQLTVQLDGPETGRRYALYNVLGQAVLSGNLPDSANNISTSGIPDGVYVLAVWAKGGTIVRKILKG